MLSCAVNIMAAVISDMMPYPCQCSKGT